MKKVVLVIIFLAMASPSFGKDKSVTICSFEWPPHHGKELHDEGYTADIIKEIFEPQGYKVKKMFLPWRRAQIFAKAGKQCDAITEIYFNKERLNYYWFGSPYSVHEVYVIGLKSHPIKDYTSLRDLKKYIIGHNRGASLSKEFDGANYLRKQETNGYGKGINLLLKKRIVFFISAKSVAFYEADKLGGRDKIQTVGKPLQRQYVHMAFSKKNPDNLLRMQDYNEGLFLLHKSGRYREIMKKHRIE